MRFQVYNAGGKWRWRLRANNNKIIASGEAYYNRNDVLKTIYLIMTMGDAVPIEFGKEKPAKAKKKQAKKISG